MNVEPQEIPDVLLITPKVFGDARGFFLESFSAQLYAEAGMTLPFVQDNCSRSKKGTLRGLHFQEPQPQGKLVWVPRGAVYDVAVDIRVGSPTFGKWVGAELSEENKRQLWVPPGFAHGFLVLSDEADFFYKCTDYYQPKHDRGILWNDPAINIEWPTLDGAELLLSDKDRKQPLLADAPALPRYPS